MHATAQLRGEVSVMNVPRTLLMTAMQGFSACRLGLWTRRVLRGGRRMGFWPAIVNRVEGIRLRGPDGGYSRGKEPVFDIAMQVVMLAAKCFGNFGVT